VLGDGDPTPGAAGALAFSVSSLGNLTAFTQLYDCFRITSVEVCFLPSFSDTFLAQAIEPFGGTNPIFRVPYVHTAIDYSNLNAPGSPGGGFPGNPVGELMEYATYVRTKGNAVHKRILKPAVSMAVVQPGSTSISGSVNDFDRWMDLQNPNVQLAGLRYYIDSPTSETLTANVPLLVNVKVVMTVEFKNVK